MKVIGIDPSLKSTGYCILENKKGIYSIVLMGNIETEKVNRSRTARIAEICETIRLLCIEHTPMILALEDYSYNSESSSLTDLAELSGCIKHTCFTSGVRLLTYPPLTVKSLCMDKELQGLKKSTILERKTYLDLIRKRFPLFQYTGNVPDVGDAFLIATTGMMELELKTKTEDDFLVALKKDNSKKMKSLKKLMMQRLVDDGILRWSKKKMTFMYKNTEIKSLDKWMKFPTFRDFIYLFRIQ